MTFGAPWGLAALVAVPAVLALHLYRRRLRERRVAALFLFGADDLAADAGRVRTRLLRSPSLWCELLAALLLAPLAAEAAFGTRVADAHVVVVLDDSASMQARSGGVDAATRARAAVAEILAAAGRDARATIVLTGDRPEIAFGPRGPATLADGALAAWTPRRPRHDPGAALTFALELAGAADRVAFVTDDPGFAVPERTETVGVGVALANDAVLAARRVRASASEESVLVDVGRFGGGPGRVTVRLYGGEEARAAVLLGETEVEVAPGVVGRAAFRLTRSDDVRRVALAGDAFPLDDDALLLPEPPRVVRATNLLPKETSLLLNLDRALDVLDDVARAPDPRDADLVFAAEPGRLEGGRTECVVSPAGDGRDDWVGPFLFDRRHPLVAGLSLAGVVWGAGDGNPPGAPLVLAGDRVLLAEERAREGFRVRINLDPARSNLPNAPDWPIFVANLVDRVRRALPGPGAAAVRVGEEMTWRPRGAVDDPASFVFETPDGRRVPGRGVGAVGCVADRPGMHRLLRDGVEVCRFAVRFADPRESDLTGLATRRLPAVRPPRGDDDAPGRDGGGRFERRLAALLLLGAVVADWLFLRRGGVA